MDEDRTSAPDGAEADDERRTGEKDRSAGDPRTAHQDEDRPGHMTPEEFRRRGHQVVDWVARYMDEVETFPVRSRVEPGEIRGRLPEAAPERGEPFEEVLADLDEIVMPGITHWQSPSFFAYFPANASGPAILGDLVSSGLGVQGMMWATSPACTELETRVLDWLVGMLELPDAFLSTNEGGGVIQDTASSASLCALLAARERATGFATNEVGLARGARDRESGEPTRRSSLDGPDVPCEPGDTLPKGKVPVAYASREAHSSIEKAAMVAGIGRENVRKISVDDEFAMDPQALEEAVRADLDAGREPFFVVATVGTTSSTAIDPVAEIGEICRRHGLWLHVDAALAGTAALCPEFRWIHQGLEAADSYCFNPHKWMLTNFDCDCFWVADRKALIDTLSILPEYLRAEASATDRAFDYRDWHVPMGRRFRSLKLWFVIRHYGVEGLRAHVRRHVGLAGELAGWIDDADRFELAAPVPLNLVCFRHRGGDEINERLMERLNASGDLYLTHTRLRGRFTLRLCVGSTFTERRHVEAAWAAIRETADEITE